MTTEETHDAVLAYLSTVSVKHHISSAGTSRSKEWECDIWRVTLSRASEQESFEYRTGTGHRKIPKIRAGEARYIKHQLAIKSLSHHNANYQLEQLKVPIAPHIASVLHCLVSNIRNTDSSFEIWADEYGYNKDSRKDFRVYEACQEETRKLFKVFTKEQVQHLETLLEDY